MSNAWVRPLNSKSQVKKAGKTIVRDGVAPEDRAAALGVVNNWRSAHSFPLNTLQVGLRRHAGAVDPSALVYQRLKRLPSIEGKLSRERTMDLARMQDLGGARAVMESVADVDAVVRRLKTSRHRHRLVSSDDYIANPKASGYRGVHMIYAFQSDQSPDWNGLMVELQVRTAVQHAWATAVETVSLFTDQALKASSGDERWLRFFVLASAAFAEREGRPLVPGAPDDPSELHDELVSLSQDLQVMSRLNAYRISVEQVDKLQGTPYTVLALNMDTSSLTVHPFDRLDDATATYARVEAETEDDDAVDVVLVRVNNMATLRQAYPNYFLDTTRFLALLEDVIDQ